MYYSAGIRKVHLALTILVLYHCVIFSLASRVVPAPMPNGAGCMMQCRSVLCMEYHESVPSGVERGQMKEWDDSLPGIHGPLPSCLHLCEEICDGARQPHVMSAFGNQLNATTPSGFSFSPLRSSVAHSQRAQLGSRSTRRRTRGKRASKDVCKDWADACYVALRTKGYWTIVARAFCVTVLQVVPCILGVRCSG